MATHSEYIYTTENEEEENRYESLYVAEKEKSEHLNTLCQDLAEQLHTWQAMDEQGKLYCNIVEDQCQTSVESYE